MSLTTDVADRHAAGLQVTRQAGQMFGQITIYTLLDDRLEDFDRMTERVVEQVTSLEPGTLVYIVHAVPTAPMQRILYEVYRDRAAYDEHMAQPYVARYVAERRSMVLATNAIELGLQQAKVSPLPSYSAISDILSESGIDLTGVTKSSRTQGSHHGQTGHYVRGATARSGSTGGPSHASSRVRGLAATTRADPTWMSQATKTGRCVTRIPGTGDHAAHDHAALAAGLSPLR